MLVENLRWFIEDFIHNIAEAKLRDHASSQASLHLLRRLGQRNKGNVFDKGIALVQGVERRTEKGESRREEEVGLVNGLEVPENEGVGLVDGLEVPGNEEAGLVDGQEGPKKEEVALVGARDGPETWGGGHKGHVYEKGIALVQGVERRIEKGEKGSQEEVCIERLPPVFFCCGMNWRCFAALIVGVLIVLFFRLNFQNGQSFEWHLLACIM